MKTEDIINILKIIQPDIDKIEDCAAKKAVSVLLNFLEELASDIARLRQENQELKDEINRLKGEHGKPEIKANIRKDGNISSEQERKSAEQLDNEQSKHEGFKLDKVSLEKLKEQRLPIQLLEQLESLNSKKYSNEKEFLTAVEAVTGKDLTEQYKALLVKYARYKKRKGSAKLPEIKIDREQKCSMDTTQLPQDAEFKGYEEKVVQDLLIKTDNVKFKRELYYSSFLKKTYLADVPNGYEGDYGPNINSYIVSMKYVNNMSIPKIKEFLRNFGILISRSYISERLTKEKHINVFHCEKSEIHRSSLQVSSYQQIDDTGSRVDGKNNYTHILCNPLCTLFFTTERKDRLTVLDILRNFESRSFVFNEETFVLLEQLKVPKKIMQLLHEVIVPGQVLTEDEMEALLEKVFSDSSKGQQHSTRILEAAAIASYHKETGTSIVKVLVSDDAPQFKLLTDEQSLCWVHDARHYKRLKPVVPKHQEQLTEFRGQYWKYYRKLFNYKHSPTVEASELLSAEFDVLFSTKTGYDELDERIARSKDKKKDLLTVLKYPEVPLHNNLSENGARIQKRREDVSLHTKSKDGTAAKDTMMSIVETSKKLGVSAYRFIFDRVSKNFALPSLAELIIAKANPQPIYSDTS